MSIPLPLPHRGTGAEISGEVRQADQQRLDVLGTILRFGGSSVGLVQQVPGYDTYPRHVGSSSAVSDDRVLCRTQARSTRYTGSTLRDVLALPPADQARELLAALTLNKSQLAEICGVSRPTLYDWLDGKEPSVANAQRITRLLGALWRAGVTSSAPLNARYVRQPLSEGAPSLVEAFSAEHPDEDALVSLLREARSLGDSAHARLRTRQERLRALGYDEPSDEQTKDQLARNIAMRDWAKP